MSVFTSFMAIVSNESEFNRGYKSIAYISSAFRSNYTQAVRQQSNIAGSTISLNYHLHESTNLTGYTNKSSSFRSSIKITIP